MKAFLLDIDGTTLLGPEALPGAPEFIAALRAKGRRHLWITNNTSRSRAGWRRRLEAAGLDPRPEEIYTAGDATIDHLCAKDPVPRVYLVGTPELAVQFGDLVAVPTVFVFAPGGELVRTFYGAPPELKDQLEALVEELAAR